MIRKNLLGISKALLGKPIYRIENVERVVEILKTNLLTLVSTAKWEDPFENFLLSAKMKVGGQIFTFADHARFYGSCWTRKGSSDAMWRIYSPDKQAVRLRTSIPKLAQSLWKACGDRAQRSAFIGRVRYFSQKALIAKAKSGEFHPNIADSSFPGVRSLLMKRTAFSHEREIRLLYLDRASRASDGLFKFAVDPNDLIESILVDPRASSEDYKSIERRIRRAGFQGRISQSRLYAPPPQIFIAT